MFNSPTLLRRCSIAVSFCLIALGTGCAYRFHPKTIVGERTDYNAAIVQSQHEQLLLNLVRLRYQDPPFFLELNSVVSSQGLDYSAAAGGFVPTQKSPAVSLGGSISYGQHPTISYAPMQGQDFAKRMLSPLPVESIILLSRSGWNISRLMHLSVDRINQYQNSINNNGTNEMDFQDFDQLVDDFRELQRTSSASLDLCQDSPGAPRIFISAPDDVSGPRRQAVERVRAKLGLDPKLREFKLTTSPLRKGPDEICIQSRSLLGMLFFLSYSVEIPESHVRKGLVKQKVDDSGNLLDHSQLTKDIMQVRCSILKPSNALICSNYRGYWFYIADDDLSSKTTFSLLTYLFSLQAVSGNSAAPLLTLPLGR